MEEAFLSFDVEATGPAASIQIGVRVCTYDEDPSEGMNRLNVWLREVYQKYNIKEWVA